MHAFPPRLRAIVLFWLLSFCFGPLVRATTVTAPTFDELVNEAQIIVRARVLEVRSAWAESPQGRVIKTYVTVGIEKQLKGAAAARLTLEFLGGEIDGQGMRVSGMPQFAAGQVEILFISGNGVRFCPLVAMMHGRYRVQTDPASGREYMTRDDGVPLTSEHDVQLPQAENPPGRQLKPVSAALSPAVFEQRIASQLSRRAALP